MSRLHLLFRFLSLIVCLTICGGDVRADDADQIEFFEEKIRPVLVEHCYECHAVDSKKQRGGLLLDSRESIRQGGDSGAGVEPGNPEDSLVLQALRYDAFEMPPRGQLPPEVIHDFEVWIKNGAVDPREAGAATDEVEIDIEQGREFWCFQPRANVRLPNVEDTAWPESTLDLFVRAKQEEVGLAPVEDAERSILLRRAHYALTGLPPNPDDIDRFLDDSDPTPVAFARVVDRLLESHHFGERWGRHWLDVVRFAESSGGGRTLLFPDAWRYRDYVIEAFNADMPFDQFVREQLAGDLLAQDVPVEDWQLRRQLLTATSFLLLGPTNYELQDKDTLEMDIVDEQLDTIGKSFLGMTIGCARCHDHKFDPIPTHDYYAMAGILKGTQSVIHDNVSKWNTVKLPVSPESRAELTEHEAKLKAWQTEIAELKKAKSKTAKEKDKSKADMLTQRIKVLEKELKTAKAGGPVWPLAMATTDEKGAADIPIAIRGVVHNSGEVVQRGVLQVATQSPFPVIGEGASGRRELADWIADAKHPLTSRVIVNRVWYWLFGEGLVRTVDNFGATGEQPSHPELLDFLANEFVEDGQSMKRLIRRLMLSRTYRLSSQASSPGGGGLVTDSANRMLWKMNRHRMEAESIRDTLLQLSGSLDLRQGGSNIKPGTKIEYDYSFDSTRRSVYVPVFRNTLPDLFATFDFADPNIQIGKRISSTVAPQALLLMNDPFVIEQCEQAGRRIAASDLELDERIELCFQRVLARKPTKAECKMADEFLAAGQGSRSWALLIQTLVQSVDYRYIR